MLKAIPLPQKKLCSNLLSNHRGHLDPYGQKTQQMTKIFEKLEKIVKISINLRVFVWITKTYSS